MANIDEHAGGRFIVRPPEVGDGHELGILWKALWDLHESWGGYAATEDDSVYGEVAKRIDDHARLRRGEAALGPHIHLVATMSGRIVGQVEGWCDRLGGSPRTPITCDIRSLIVASDAREYGIGGALVGRLIVAAEQVADGHPLVISAEVHAKNPANEFYVKRGFRPVACSYRLATNHSATIAPRLAAGVRARTATRVDAAAVAALDALLAKFRWETRKDRRFDAPSPPDPQLIELIAAHLETATDGAPRELVAVSPQGDVLGSATFVVSSLEAPFVPAARAMLGRFAFRNEPVTPSAMSALIATASGMARRDRAESLELADLGPEDADLLRVVSAHGATPWSQTYVREMFASK